MEIPEEARQERENQIRELEIALLAEEAKLVMLKKLRECQQNQNAQKIVIFIKKIISVKKHRNMTLDNEDYRYMNIFNY